MLLLVWNCHLPKDNIYELLSFTGYCVSFWRAFDDSHWLRSHSVLTGHIVCDLLNHQIKKVSIHVGHPMQEVVFGHIPTEKVQISLCICAVWSGPPLSANSHWILQMYERRAKVQMPGWYFVHAQDDLNPHILRMFEGTFFLDTAHVMSLK